MQDGVNEDGSGRLFVEADAVVADAEAEFAGVSLQLLDVALAGAGLAAAFPAVGSGVVAGCPGD